MTKEHGYDELGNASKNESTTLKREHAVRVRVCGAYCVCTCGVIDVVSGPSMVSHGVPIVALLHVPQQCFWLHVAGWLGLLRFSRWFHLECLAF